VGKKRKVGGFGQKGLLLPPSPIQNRERGASSGGRSGGRGRRRSRPWWRSGSGSKWRGGRGGSIPVLTLSWGGAGRWIGGRRWFACWRLWWWHGGVQGGCGGSIARCGAARGWCWPFIGVIGRFPGKISLRRPRHRLRQGGPRWSALDWRYDGSGEVSYRPVDGTTRAGEGLGRPWWQRRQLGGVVRRDGSGRGVMAAKSRPGWLAGTCDQARRGPAVA
jgi:hypothetical protein